MSSHCVACQARKQGRTAGGGGLTLHIHIHTPHHNHHPTARQDRLYARCQELGITLLTVALTVAHRRSLWRHHDHLLQLDGKGGWSFRPMADVEPEAHSHK